MPRAAATRKGAGDGQVLDQGELRGRRHQGVDVRRRLEATSRLLRLRSSRWVEPSIAFYFAFGDTDVFAICDFPDIASATAMSLAINATGAVALSLTPLMTPEDVDAAMAKSPKYRKPGG